jgi:hypothetical protein
MVYNRWNRWIRRGIERSILTSGNKSDVEGADLLLGETIGMKRVIAARG